MKIVAFLLTSIVLVFTLTKLAAHTITDGGVFSVRYALFGVPIILAFAAFWWWLFRTPRR